MWWLVLYAMDSMLAKQERNFPQDGQHTTDKAGNTYDSIQMALYQHYSMFHGIENKPPIHYS